MRNTFIKISAIFVYFTPIFFLSAEEYSKKRENLKVDKDGFEIISTTIPQNVISEINQNYVRSIKPIFLGKCLVCHGASNSRPWYYHLPIIRGYIDNDINEAKTHMDMSNDFPFSGHGTPGDDLNALDKILTKDSMPPPAFKILHWDSGLNSHEVLTIRQWIKNSQNSISAPHSSELPKEN